MRLSFFVSRAILLAGLLGLTLNISFCQAQDSTETPAKNDGDGKRQIMIYRANHTAVDELTRALSNILDNDNSNVRFASAPSSNSLALVGDGETLQQISAMLSRLDQAPKMVGIHMYVVAPGDEPLDRSAFNGSNKEIEKVIRELARQDRISVVNEIHLSALEQQESMVQCGKRKALVTGRSGRSISPTALASLRRRAESDDRQKALLASAERMAKTYSNVNVGSLLKAVPRVVEDGTILIDMTWERSNVVPAQSDDTPPDMTQATVNATVRVANGQSTFVQEISDPTLDNKWLLVVGAETLDTSAKTVDTKSSVTSNPRAVTPQQDDESSVSQDLPDKYRKYAAIIFKRYDKDKDGTLSEDEISAMRRPPKDADENQDGKVSPEEYARSLR